MTKIIYNPSHFIDTQKLLGKRPGNYHVDPYYLRRGFGNKVFLWIDGVWRLLAPGDTIIQHADGTVDREKESV